jgi:hypothetical protein
VGLNRHDAHVALGGLRSSSHLLRLNPLWLSIGALAGYLLLMWTNPVRASLRDGLRILRRHPLLWIVLGLFGFCYALYGLGMRHLISGYAPDDPELKLEWTMASPAWALDRSDIRAAAREAFLPTLDSTAGLFNNLVSTFPFAALAALLLLLNWRGHQAVLIGALRKRFGKGGWAIHCCIVVCAIAAIIKPFLTWLMVAFPSEVSAAPDAVPPQLSFWVQWARVLAWLAFLFEYIFGVCIQIYLILLAYCWVRGISFDHQRLLDFAIRRFSLVVRFAAVVLILSTILIDLPLVLGDFGLLPQWPFLQDENSGVLIEQWALRARAIIAVFLLMFASVQITLTFHSESLRKAFSDHFRLLRRYGWPIFWFIMVALVHFYFAHVLNSILVRAVGDGTLLWILWRCLFPWIAGAVGAWLLASWVSLYKRCDSDHVSADNWIQF